LLEPVEQAARAVHIHAAQRDYPAGDASQDAHELTRLCSGAQDQIDHDVGCEGADGRLGVAELPAVANDPR